MSNVGPLLPYEAAQLAASASSVQQHRTFGKLILLCLTGIMMTASVVSGVIVWSVHDDGVVSSSVQGSVYSNQPANPSSGLSAASDDRRLLPDNSLMSPPVSIQNGGALASVQKNEANAVNDRTKPSFASEGPPATLVTAASSRSMVNRIESSIAARPPKLIAQDREASGFVSRQIKRHRDAKTDHQDSISLARHQHKPSFKPLDVAASLPPALVPTSFRPAFKSRETSTLKPPRAGLSASSDAIGGEKHVLMLKRFWGTLVQGVAEAFRNRDTSYQLVMKADSDGGDRKEHRGGGNDYDGHDG